MTAPAPGDWFVDANNPMVVHIRVVSGMYAVVNCGSAENARLVKAAPNMLNVLRLCEEYFDQRADAEYTPASSAPIGNEEMTMLTDVRAVITEATGEPS